MTFVAISVLPELGSTSVFGRDVFFVRQDTRLIAGKTAAQFLVL